MKVFIKSVIYFFSWPLLLLVLAFCLPPSPRVRGSLLFAQTKKEDRLKSIENRKLVLVGGSNLSFGVNSKELETELNCSVVNMGLQASVGADFQIRSVMDQLRSGDALVLCLEYNNYFGDFAYGSEPLLRLALDVNKKEFKKFEWHNYYNTISYIPQFCLSKVDPRNYFFRRNPADRIYSVDAFNKYGDATAHYGLPAVEFAPESRFIAPINYDFISALKGIQKQLENRKVQMYLVFPPFEEQSFKNSSDRIEEVYQILVNMQLPVLGEPNDRMMPRTLFFNTPYHLSQEGVEVNTNYLIQVLASHTL